MQQNQQRRKRKGGNPQSQFQAVMNQVAQLQAQVAASAAQQARPSQVKKKNRKGRQKQGGRQGGVGLAVKTQLAFVGMRDKGALCSSYTFGYVFIGNGVNGVTNAVLFMTSNSATLFGSQGAGPQPIVPILPGDAVLGKSYIADESKHYSRRRYKRLLLHIDSLQPNTNSALVLVVAPVRGSAQAMATVPSALATATASQATMDSVRSMKGNVYLNSFEDSAKRTTLDLTPYIAGGSGPRQDEFSIPAVANVTTAVVNGTVLGTTAGALSGVSPCGIMVSGQNTIAGNQNTSVFELVIEMEYDLLDFTGGNPAPNALG
jgi:hypothetical protein